MRARRLLLSRHWWLVLLASFVVLGGLLVFVLRSPGVESSVSDDEATTLATVRYDGTTFTPRTLRVPAGTRVTFMNASPLERPLYVASNPHPTHGDYPGLDARAINGGAFPEPGTHQSFTFDRRGVWGYHDHNFPEARGTVEVY